MALSEKNPDTGKNNKANILIFLLLLVSIVGISFFVYLKSQNIDIEKVNINQIFQENLLALNKAQPDEKAVEINYDPKERPVFCVYKDYIIRSSSDGLKGLNKKGEEEWAVPAAFNSPIIRTSGAYLMAADKGGKEIYVLNGKSVLWSKKTDNNIINADISQSGHVAVVQEAKGYKGAVTVFNLQGNEFFTRTIAESFLLMAKVAPAGNQVIINSIDDSGITVNSILALFNMAGDRIASLKVPKEDIVFPSIWFLDNESILAVSDSLAVCYDKDKKEKWKQEFEGKRILSSSIALGKYSVLAVGEDNQGLFNSKKTEIKIFNLNGQQASSYTIDDEVGTVETYSDIIAAVSGKEVYFISTRGSLIGKYTSKTDVMGVYFFNKQEVAVVSKNSVVITKVK